MSLESVHTAMVEAYVEYYYHFDVIYKFPSDSITALMCQSWFD